MELKEIYKIVDRYYNGETTLKEEEMLRDYFERNEVPEDLKSAQMLFGYFKHEREEDIDIPVQHPGKGRRRDLYLRLMGAAAGLALLFVVGNQIYHIEPNEAVLMNIIVLDSPEEEAQALEETQKALNLISEKFNLGTKKMENLSKADKINEVFKLKK